MFPCEQAGWYFINNDLLFSSWMTTKKNTFCISCPSNGFCKSDYHFVFVNNFKTKKYPKVYINLFISCMLDQPHISNWSDVTLYCSWLYSVFQIMYWIIFKWYFMFNKATITSSDSHTVKTNEPTATQQQPAGPSDTRTR